MSINRMIKEKVKNENIFEYSKKITNLDDYFNSNHKKAIILCAGKGTRLKEWTKYSPKPLFPIKNKPIIEYNIEFLIDNGIKDIVLVVGYKAKQFNYIKNKYNANIKLIYNDKYNKYNNWYSILKAKEEIIDNNVLIIDGDILIIEHNIKINNLKENSYIFCQKGGNNWGITFDKDTKLVESIVPGDAKNEYVMFGFFYLNKEMTRDYVEEIERLKENDYHDYAMINLIKNGKKFFTYLLEPSMVVEVDSIQDVIDCKIMDKNEVKSIIKSKKLKNKIKKTLLKILCMFVPSRRLRHIIRGHENKYNELQSQINFLYQILDSTIEKTKMKPVKKIRDYQLKILDNLIFFDSICRKHNIKYWLDSGTLLGAIRHNGFIPWDDDLDVCVMREDYEKLYFEILPKELENSDYYFYINCVNVKQKYDYQLLKIYGKEFFIDVLAYDYYYGKLETREDRIDFNKKYNLALNYYNDRKLQNDFNYFADVKKIIKEIINDNKTLRDNNNPKIIAGIDFPHLYKGEFDYDVIFPLKEIEFEGYKFFAPNNSDKYLKNMFGYDYDKLPRCSHTHSLINRF